MKRKILGTIASALFAAAFVASATEAAPRIPEIRRAGMEHVIQRVQLAFRTRGSCRELFAMYGGDPRDTLNRAVFIDVGDKLNALGFAAATLVGTNRTLVGDVFYANLGDVEGLATLLIHELLHQQGAGPEIDNYVENYEQISRSCGTRNSAK